MISARLFRGSLAFLTLAALLGLAISGIVAAQEVKLTWSTWMGEEALEAYKRRFEEFERRYPHIDVEILMVPGGYDEYKAKLLTMIATGSGPDVAHTNILDVDFLIQNGLLLDVTKYAQEIDRDAYFLSDTTQKNGRVWGGFESHVQVYPVYYNVDLFEQAGLEDPNSLFSRDAWTWDTFRDAAIKLTRLSSDGTPIQHGLSMLADQWEIGWSHFLLTNGLDYINDERDQLLLDRPEVVDSLSLVADLVTYPGLNGWGTFIQGQAGMELQGSWMMSWYRHVTGFDWDIAPMPVGSSRTVYRAPGIDGLVLASTKHPDEAWLLVRFLLDDYVQMDKAESKLEVPILRSAVSSPVYQTAPPKSMHVIGDLLQRSIPQPTFLGAREVIATIEGALRPAIFGEQSMANAVKEAQRIGQAVLEEYLTGKR